MKKWSTNERREEIMRMLCAQRRMNIAQLVGHFGVSRRTIQYDIDALTCSYPIVTKPGRYGGGIEIPDGYYIGRNYLDTEQQALLRKLAGSLAGAELETMESILKTFALPAK